jgi:hypothetical protein
MEREKKRKREREEEIVRDNRLIITRRHEKTNSFPLMLN